MNRRINSASHRVMFMVLAFTCVSVLPDEDCQRIVETLSIKKFFFTGESPKQLQRFPTAFFLYTTSELMESQLRICCLLTTIKHIHTRQRQWLARYYISPTLPPARTVCFSEALFDASSSMLKTCCPWEIPQPTCIMTLSYGHSLKNHIGQY